MTGEMISLLHYIKQMHKTIKLRSLEMLSEKKRKEKENMNMVLKVFQ
jgi:hypothetical protein